MSQGTMGEEKVTKDEASLKEIIVKLSKWFKFLLTKWKVILISAVIGGLLGFAYASSRKIMYTAKLSFALEDSKGGALGAYTGIASQFGLDLGGNNGGNAFSGDNLLELIKSRLIVERSLLSTATIDGKTQTLADFYIDFNNFRKKWAGNPKLKNIQFPPNSDPSKFTFQQDSLMGVFYETLTSANLAVDKIDKKLSIFVVVVSSKNELFSKYFTESVVSNVSNFYIDTKTKKSTRNVIVLQHQTDSVRGELNAAIQGVANSVDHTPNANPGRSELRVPSQHRQVDVQVNTAILAELVKNLEVAKMSLRNETPLVQIIDEPILPLAKQKFGKGKGIMMGCLVAVFLVVVLMTLKKVYYDL